MGKPSGLGNYTESARFAEKAKTNAVSVIKQGFYEPVEEPAGPDYEMLITGIVIIILSIAVLYVVRNRKKLSKFVSGEQGEEEYEYEF